MALFGRQTISAQTIARMKEMRRRGHGVKLHDWEVAEFDPSAPHGIVENVVDWCKRTVAECRRPYGINSFDLTLAFRVGADGAVRSLNFKRMKPIELYDDSFAARLLEALGLHAAQPVPLRVSAGFFSWGDAAHQALSRESS
jgi:hypothetical protein